MPNIAISVEKLPEKLSEEQIVACKEIITDYTIKVKKWEPDSFIIKYYGDCSPKTEEAGFTVVNKEDDEKGGKDTNHSMRGNQGGRRFEVTVNIKTMQITQVSYIR
ncbi:hypothetical protein [Desulfovibrio litoralis]|nr:hypothetical protein [Desulfovibrio litoralis]